MEQELLTIYKAIRLPLLVFALTFIIFYVYNKKRKDRLEAPKYRMLDED
jgi:cbb3-type cytochrome oxidase subunit 3